MAAWSTTENQREEAAEDEEEEGGIHLGSSPQLCWIKRSSKHPEFNNGILRVVHVF